MEEATKVVAGAGMETLTATSMEATKMTEGERENPPVVLVLAQDSG